MSNISPQIFPNKTWWDLAPPKKKWMVWMAWRATPTFLTGELVDARQVQGHRNWGVRYDFCPPKTYWSNTVHPVSVFAWMFRGYFKSRMQRLRHRVTFRRALDFRRFCCQPFVPLQWAPGKGGKVDICGTVVRKAMYLLHPSWRKV